MENTLIIIDGPTASGKTSLAYNWALQLECPILSADSRQVFRDVNIGTCKPPDFMLNNIQHFFINHVAVDGSFSVGQFEQEASALLEKLFAQHPVLILCGGTGLYIKSLVYGIDQLPSSSEASKLQSQNLLSTEGLEGCRTYLAKIDPSYYAIVDLNNSRRILRALEVYFESGKPYSSFLNKPKKEPSFQVKEIYLLPPRPLLYDRIDQRVDAMINQGLFEEVQSLLSYRSCQALQTVGYREVFDFLDGKITKDRCIELIKQNTRNYAKRQITWFNKECTGTTVNSSDPNQLEIIREQLNYLFPR